MRIVNMMPFDIHVYGRGTIEDGPEVSYPVSGKVAHISSTEVWAELGPEVWYGDLEELPPPCQDVMYIVSLVAALAGRTRGDLLSPYKKVRDKDHKIVGCRYLQRVR